MHQHLILQVLHSKYWDHVTQVPPLWFTLPYKHQQQMLEKNMKRNLRKSWREDYTLWYEFSSCAFDGETLKEVGVLVWPLILEPRLLPEAGLPLPRPCLLLFISMTGFGSVVSATLCPMSATAYDSFSLSITMLFLCLKSKKKKMVQKHLNSW